MIEISTRTEEINEDNLTNTLKRYYIQSDYPHTSIKVKIDELENQITTDYNGVGVISTFDIKEHSIEVEINEEVFSDTL